MDEISNDERLRRIPIDVAAIIGAAERGDPDLVQENIEELTALFVQLAASYAAAGHNRMLADLERHFATQLQDGTSCFIMPVNRLVVRQN